MGRIHHISLSIGSLVLMHVAAVASLRNLPLMAEAGLSMLFFFGLALLIFFIPSALVSAELAASHPGSGGVYDWVEDAFGKRAAFMALWLQVAKGFVWFPTVLAFVAGTLAYIISPELAENRFYTLGAILAIFWISLYLTSHGHRTSAGITRLGSILGILIPGLFIIGLGAYWLLSGKPSNMQLNWSACVPDLANFHELSFLATMLVTLTGMEVIAVHASHLQNPQKEYPKVVFLSSLIIPAVLVLGSLAIAIIVPQEAISLDAGVVQAFAGIFRHLGMPALTPLIAAAMIFGALAAIQVWLMSPAKALLKAAEGGLLPCYFTQTNQQGVPVRILIIQGVIISLFACCFLLMPSINSCFWMLTAIRASLYLMMYLFLFAAAIRLRFQHPHRPRPFAIPGGRFGMLLVAGLGFVAALFGLLVAFIPTQKFSMGNLWLVEGIQIGSVLLFISIPLIINRFSPQRTAQAPAQAPHLLPAQEPEKVEV